MARSSTETKDIAERLSFAEASRLTRMPKAFLRELAESGQLAVHLVPGADGPKMRVSHASLSEAGLISAQARQLPAVDGELHDLIALVRDQSARIAALEEQRFQLGAQLGAAVERVAALEERITALPAGDESASHPANLNVTSSPLDEAPELIALTTGAELARVTSKRGVIFKLGERGARRSAELGTRVLNGRLRLMGRLQ